MLINIGDLFKLDMKGEIDKIIDPSNLFKAFHFKQFFPKIMMVWWKNNI